MVNPNISRKTENIIEVTEDAKKLFQVIYNEKSKKEESDDETPKIKVSTLISKMAFYYEKIRNSVDYKEEHLLRKNAVLRIIKRQIVIEGSIQEVNAEDISKHLLVELIRAGYLHNNKVPEIKIREVSYIIERYIKLRHHVLECSPADFKARRNAVNFLLSMAACEIEENLGRDRVDQVIISDIYETLKGSLKLPEGSSYSGDLGIQIFIGIHRNYLKFDVDMAGFILFKYYNGDWKDYDDNAIEKLGKSFDALMGAIKEQLEHPLSGQLSRIISRYSVYFTVLRDVIREDPVGVYGNIKNDYKAFPRDIKKICNRKYATAKSKLWRAAVRSIIYIFLTKSVFAIALEVPATQFFGETLNLFALGINVIFPAFLLFVIVLFTALPSDANTDKIVEGIKSLVLVGHNKKDPIILRPPVKRSGILNSIFNLIYSSAFLVSIGFIVYFLDRIGFNFVSIIIFLFFLAFVSFFAIRIRKNAHEMIIVEGKESFLSFLTDFFYIPIVAVGKWLSEKFSRINVFVFILDFIIEAPFKIFVDIAEEWAKYVKERRDEIV